MSLVSQHVPTTASPGSTGNAHTPQPNRPSPPLRVLLTREAGFQKLLISGRMADVCAELNRLVLH